MKKLFFGVSVFVLLTGVARAGDDLDLLSDEMLFSGENIDVSAEEEPEEAENKKTGFFGFIAKFFGMGDDKTDDVPQESFVEQNTRLAKEGDVEAQMNLAYMYLYGVGGVKEDHEKSVKYYEMAAKQDNPIALNNLGSLYFNGIGVRKNVAKALYLFDQAAELGNENAAINLAFIYLTGAKKDSVRNQKAVNFLQKAQEKSNIAKFMLGYAYYRGFVVKQDYEQAFKLINEAAIGDARIDEAQLVLGHFYRHGYGTVQNYQKAVESYRFAAKQGNMEAIVTLANVYSHGKICPQNIPMAHALWNIAAARNVPNAAKMRDDLVKAANINLETLAQAHSIAQEYKPLPSELTSYIRQTYGTDIRSYIDQNMMVPRPNEDEENESPK